MFVYGLVFVSLHVVISRFVCLWLYINMFVSTSVCYRLYRDHLYQEILYLGLHVFACCCVWMWMFDLHL